MSTFPVQSSTQTPQDHGHHRPPSSQPAPKKITQITPKEADAIGHQRFLTEIREIGQRIVKNTKG